jgi:hypothetical protein
MQGLTEVDERPRTRRYGVSDQRARDETDWHGHQ